MFHFFLVRRRVKEGVADHSASFVVPRIRFQGGAWEVLSLRRVFPRGNLRSSPVRFRAGHTFPSRQFPVVGLLAGFDPLSFVRVMISLPLCDIEGISRLFLRARLRHAALSIREDRSIELADRSASFVVPWIPYQGGTLVLRYHRYH